ncbi:MAG: hypothetical protein M3P06_23805 [Acidobacteriota bacterium]|nr:hypothetical protein [Acidobacteriota bacterium]
MRLTSAATGLCVLLLTLPVLADQFDDALAAAKANAKTSEGANYDTTFGRAFAEKHAGTMVRCTQEVPVAGLANFDLLVNVDGAGVVDQVLVRPTTEVARCLQAAVQKDTYPEPPEPKYWVHVAMSITE